MTCLCFGTIEFQLGHPNTSSFVVVLFLNERYNTNNHFLFYGIKSIKHPRKRNICKCNELYISLCTNIHERKSAGKKDKLTY